MWNKLKSYFSRSHGPDDWIRGKRSSVNRRTGEKRYHDEKPQYQQGDRKMIEGMEHEFRGTNWHKANLKPWE